ncbi:DNA-3-methyladenine glycosylase I [Phocicoccus pinnipedialis]|uniref:DNA-3-methyladenine glycosylase 1 n=1 Tax=Phocicoccus pinnipedialis TaxID=110845 RepID=A0A6V7RCH2_9BACL|nr:DNA-3-methyladenine glycosylase I [Jeotgalicoccus pinnipedialis]MBP1939429.1 DNA-3-methyladenine glycosylase I [Jeotgalicoccus pinnipedialis]CAD2075434.1 DNA-3-methyladenine glycosylase 1 [Jeotgalicoccus pinnipedialis]
MIKPTWAKSHPLLEAYYENEWGKPSNDDRHLFEMLILEGFQAGLSWLTILKKREAFKEAFLDFDYEKIAKFDDEDIERILSTEDMIRNKLKISCAIKNAAQYKTVQEEFGSFSNYLWSFVGRKPVVTNYDYETDIPVQNDLSVLISKDLKKRGFKFVGPVIIYSYLQAVGVIDDRILHEQNKLGGC